VPDKPTTAVGYGPEFLERARRTCLHVATVIAEKPDVFNAYQQTAAPMGGGPLSWGRARGWGRRCVADPMRTLWGDPPNRHPARGREPARAAGRGFPEVPHGFPDCGADEDAARTGIGAELACTAALTAERLRPVAVP
jgi:hypothetical protein